MAIDFQAPFAKRENLQNHACPQSELGDKRATPLKQAGAHNDCIPAFRFPATAYGAPSRLVGEPGGLRGRFAVADTPVPPAADAGPFHNTANGHFDKNSVEGFVDGMKNELSMRSAYVLDYELGIELGGAVRRQMTRITALLENLTRDCRNPDISPDEAARTCFAEISKICKSLCTQLDKSTKTFWRRNKPATAIVPKKILSSFFSDYGNLANELKRNHYTRAAKHRLDAYVAQEASNISAVAGGLRENRTAAELKTAKTIGGALRVGFPFSSLLSAGPAVGYQFLRQKRIFVDDDRASVILEEDFHTLSVGGYLKHGKLIDKNNKGHTLFTLYAVASAFLSRGSYHKHATLEAGLEHQVFRQSKKYTCFFRSGDLNSWGNRKCLAAGQHYAKRMQQLVGERYVATKGMPIMDQNKLQKGLNTGRLATLSAALVTSRPPGHQGAGSSDLREITALAYPTIESTLQQRERAIAADPHCPTASKPVYNPLTAIRPLPFPANSEIPESEKSVKRFGGAVDAGATVNSLQLNRHHHQEIHAGASARARSEVSYNKIGFTRLGGSHTQMDPRVTRSIVRADALVAGLKNHFGEQHPQLHRLRQVENACLPLPLEAPTAAAVSARYESASRQLAEIRTDFIEFVGIAQELHALKDAAYRQRRSPAEVQSFELKKANMIRKIFGDHTNPALDAQQKKFFTKVQNDPQYLMERCFDAMSIGLGRIGILTYHLKKANADLQLRGPVANDVATLRNKLDADYAHTRRLLEEVHLPVNRAEFFRTATLTCMSSSISTVGSFGFEAKIGVYHAPLQDIRGNASDPSSALTTPSEAAHGTELNPAFIKTHGPKPSAGTFSANTATVSGSYTWLQRHSTSHPNPIRLGDFEQHITIVAGGGALSSVLESTIQKGVDKRLQKEVGPANRYASEPGRTGNVVPVIAALARTQVCDDSSDIAYVVQTKTPNSVGHLVYETSEQCARAIVHRSQSTKLSVGFPLHGIKLPAILSVNAGTSTVSQSIIAETYGDCPAYHLLGFSRLDKLLKNKDCDTATPRQRWQRPLPQDRYPVPPECLYPRAVAVPGTDPCDSYQGPLFNYEKLQEKLLSEINQPRDKAAKEDGADSGSDLDATYMMVNYFANPKAITGVLEKFCRYQGEMRAMGAAQPVASAKNERTEFHRFDDDPDLWGCMQSMQESAQFGPGTTPTPRRGMESMHEYANMNPDPRPRMSDQEIDALEQVTAHFKRFPQLSSAERMRYFLNPVLGSYGQIAFQAYVRIMVRYEKINNAAKPHHAYATHITDREPEGWLMRGKSLLKSTNHSPVNFAVEGDEDNDVP